MERELHLSEEDKDRLLYQYDKVLRTRNEDPGFKIIVEYLKEDAHAAMHKLKDVDPEDSKEIRKLQNEIWRYEALLGKVDYIINLGEAVKIEKEYSEGM